jgi:hypothetical protein
VPEDHAWSYLNPLYFIVHVVPVQAIEIPGFGSLSALFWGQQRCGENEITPINVMKRKKQQPKTRKLNMKNKSATFLDACSEFL